MKEAETLKYIAFYLEGIKQGKGDILPLGSETIETLWKLVHLLQRDVEIVSKDERSNIHYEVLKYVNTVHVKGQITLEEVAEVMSMYSGLVIKAKDLKR